MLSTVGREDPRGPGPCPVCGAEEGTAAHILETHAVPRVPLPTGAWLQGGVYYYLRTDLEPPALRRNIRLVGQLLRNGSDWRWLQ